MRYRKAVDKSQAPIKAALEKKGYFVHDLSKAGYGVPDMYVVAPDGRKKWLEAKNPRPPAKKFKDGRQRKDDLTEAERRLQGDLGAVVVRTPEEALAVFEVTDQILRELDGKPME